MACRSKNSIRFLQPGGRCDSSRQRATIWRAWSAILCFPIPISLSDRVAQAVLPKIPTTQVPEHRAFQRIRVTAQPTRMAQRNRQIQTPLARQAAISRNVLAHGGRICCRHHRKQGITIVVFSCRTFRERYEQGEDRRIEGSAGFRSEEHTSELQSRVDLVCRLLL